MPKKKILFVIWTYSWGGGAENILTNLVNHLDPQKYEIDILEYFHFNTRKEQVNDNINILSPIIDSNHTNKLEKLYKIFLVKHFPNVLRKKYIKKSYDVEIAFTKMIPSFLLDYTKKTVIWLHGDINEKTDTKRDIKLQEKYLKKASKVVLISNDNADNIIKRFPFINDKKEIIYNSFDFDSIDKKANLDKLPKSNVPVLLSLGRLDDGKNPLQLLEVATNLKNKGVIFKLQFIGDGILKEKLIDKIKENNLNDCVEVLGYKENPYPFIKNSTLLLQTSKHEGFPTVLVEGLSLGKPFVCTSVGGVYEISDDNKCGYVIENMDMNAFTNKVISLLSDKKLYKDFSLHGQEIVKKFTINKQVENFDKMIESLK